MAEQNPQSSEENKPPVDATDEQPSADAAAVDPSAESSEAADAVEPTPEEALEAVGRAAEQIKHETGDSNGDGDGNEAAQASTDAADGTPLNLEQFSGAGDAAAPIAGLNLLDDIDLQVTVELGRTRMYIEDVLRLNENSVVELDKAAGDSVDIYVNERLVARGEVLVLNENFCVRINEIISQKGIDQLESASVSNNGS